ncbi:MAG: PilW family protein [Betaproteobacteria bacterium]|nr:PilW family protein [Betaproteobacteria bacterium]
MNRAMRHDSGFSLVELMIAMTIGLLLLSGLAMIFVNSSDANRELQKTAAQIENGRYAMDLLSQDLRLAGFYGHMHDLGGISPPATTPPDPCDTDNTVVGAAGDTDLLRALRFPVQAYNGAIDAADPADDAAATGLSANCAAILTAANLKPGSDVVVVRRADTNALDATDVATSNVFYIQATADQAQVQTGNGAAVGGNKADGTAATLFLTNGASPPVPAPIRRMRVHIYFVAPCSVGSGTIAGVSGSCVAGTDDTIPTLKRLELTSAGTITLVPLVEGIEYFKVEYGVDTSPAAISVATGSSGDANVDSYTATPADWSTVIAAKIFVLARNTELTRGFTDDKSYTLGTSAVPARNDNFKRHVFSSMVHLENPAGRREIP